MTIEPDATAALAQYPADELVQFVFRPVATAGLLQRARALLDTAPRELIDSFEQAMRSSGLAS